MKRLIVILFVFSASLVSSCQCSEKPPVPPVNEDAQAEARSAAAIN